MSAQADDLRRYYANDIGPTRKLDITAGASARLPDNGGPLAPGRYLVQVFLTAGGAPTARVWIMLGKFGEDVQATAGAPSFPFSPAHLGERSLIFTALPGFHDQIAGIVEAAGAAHTLFITRIDRGPAPQ